MTRGVAPKLRRMMRALAAPDYDGERSEFRSLLAVANAVGRAKRYAHQAPNRMYEEMNKAFSAHDRLDRASKERT